MTRRRVDLRGLLLFLLLALPGAQAQDTPAREAQTPPSQTQSGDRLATMSKLLLETQHQLEQTQQQLNQLRQELDQLRAEGAAATRTQPNETTSSTISSSALETPKPTDALADQLKRQEEQQEVLQAEVKQHDQTKLESVSKYPVRVYGLLLFNTFSNAGIVDNPDLPSVALPRPPDQSHGSIGASFRQTLLGLSANGPRVFGARSSADLNIDFFGSPSYSYYGGTNGALRLRRGNISLAWGSETSARIGHDQVEVGVDAPLISPLSPTSFATVAQPALAWSGNLWNWAPELQYKHTILLSSADRPRTLELQAGLWDPPVVGVSGVSSAPIVSPGELARRPGYLGRVSFHGGSETHPFSLGFGGYSDRQTYYDGQSIHMWAVTSDWQLPLSKHFQLDGEIYRGRGLGGLGGGTYKDVLSGTDAAGLSKTIGLNAVGGWAQLKTHLFDRAEANLIFGQDGGFASDFRQLDLGANAYSLEQNERNQMIVTNFIYRPKAYIILSPEYRHIASWTLYGTPQTANVYTLSLGYQF